MKFSLRTLLIVVSLCAIYLGAWRHAWRSRYTKPIVESHVSHDGWHYTVVKVPMEMSWEGYPRLWRWPRFNRLGYANIHYADYSPTSEREGWEWLASQEAKPYLVEAKNTGARWNSDLPLDWFSE